MYELITRKPLNHLNCFTKLLNIIDNLSKFVTMQWQNYSQYTGILHGYSDIRFIKLTIIRSYNFANVNEV